ncbi:MAG: phosphatidylserine/phosphatidylglycerophosphate/cardiolipin synthase family protein [Deltaproteobacteria bacterium]|nr:phosphatidylserine/phosphatidylglycerophosphate/cardiolipin synthase family protein [Deltaproteobacteria bacterium]MCW5804583.1 phosphatidylserine/phosphatidylglycerophosphate/cardiolipin synthase family protein [Deltaproteobacteria bacterium]
MTTENKNHKKAVPIAVRDLPSRSIAVQLPRAIAPYARGQLRWRVGCEVEVLRDGAETYPAMLEALAGARTSILLETYILAADATGDRFKAVLVERARAGVAVRIIYDAVGSFGLSNAYVAELRAAGCEVVDFNPIAPWRRRFRLSHRDHRKIIVVDEVVAFTGGLNIADDYASAADGGRNWHDMHCRLTGPIVFDLARVFRRTWLRAGGAPFPPIEPAGSRVPGRGASFVRLLDNTKLRSRGAIRRTYLHVMKAARSSILIQNAYFLPDRGLRRAMVRAVQRGVDVSVVVPGHSDVRVIEWASLYVLRGLAAAGVRIFRWRGMLHAKTCVVDGTWSTIGSYNFDAISRFNNLEATVEMLDAEVGTALTRSFEQDLIVSDPYDGKVWESLPFWMKALCWLAFRFRRFL